MSDTTDRLRSRAPEMFANERPVDRDRSPIPDDLLVEYAALCRRPATPGGWGEWVQYWGGWLLDGRFTPGYVEWEARCALELVGPGRRYDGAVGDALARAAGVLTRLAEHARTASRTTAPART